MKNKSALLAGILSGITSPILIYTKPSYPTLKGSDLDRLRGDVSRVGGYFTTVIDRENGKEQQNIKD
jgi:hypothetical protein